MKQLIGTGLITLTNIADGNKIEIYYSPTEDIQFRIKGEQEPNTDRLGDIITPSWHTPSRAGDVYMVQRIGGEDSPWGPVIRMEGIAGISYRMRGTWQPGIEYIGDCEYRQDNPSQQVTPVILKGSIDLVIHEGSTFACLRSHVTEPENPEQLMDRTPPSKKDVIAAQKIEPMPEVKNEYWVLTSMLGMQGPVGEAGPAGESEPSFSLILTNENHSFLANSQGFIVSEAVNTTSTGIQAYIGTELVSANNISIGYPDNISGLKLTYDTANMIINIEALPGGDLADAGSFEITARIRYGDDADNQKTTILKKSFSWVKVKSGEAPYTISVYSTNGNVFKKGTVQTKLVATVSQGSEDVSQEMKSKVVWYKVTPTEDIEWARGVLEIEIDPSQVNGQAVFACEVEILKEEGNEQKNKEYDNSL